MEDDVKFRNLEGKASKPRGCKSVALIKCVLLIFDRPEIIEPLWRPIAQ